MGNYNVFIIKNVKIYCIFVYLIINTLKCPSNISKLCYVVFSKRKIKQNIPNFHYCRISKHTYNMGGSNLAVTTEERDLGVLIDDQLDFDKHIRGIVNRANRMLGMIKIGFACLDKEMFMNLYPVLVRPLIEYCVQVWSPNKQKHIDLLEGVQKRATKIVPELRNMTYDKRLESLGLIRLEDRRVRGDMIETYKIMTGKEDANRDIFFELAPARGDPEVA